MTSLGTAAAAGADENEPCGVIDFPGLTVSIQHGDCPYAREAPSVAYKQPNIVTVLGV